MKEVTSEKFLKKANNIFALVVMTAKRATSLSRGSKSFIPDSKHSKASMIALEEVSQGKIKLVYPKDVKTEDQKKK